MSENMKSYIKNIDLEKIEKMTALKKEYIEGKIDFETTKSIVEKNFKDITPEEFAYSEQKIKDLGFTDETVHDKMNDVLGLFRARMVQPKIELPEGHPIATYLKENKATRELIEVMKKEAEIYENDKKFIKNKWLELYDKLYEFNKHLARKQHQLFSMLERKGFDRPSRIMWTFDNAVRDNISLARKFLNEDEVDLFMEQQKMVWELTLDIMSKEEEVLFPTSLKMITDDEFKGMRAGDDEIGYCLIEKPTGFYPEKENIMQSNTENNGSFMNELAGLLSKYGMTGKNTDKEEVFDVKQGKLTLNQINLIYQHMPVDLSFVDENEIVKFYTDTKHRVFPRSAGVIGRDVKNCHPRESVDTVMRIIDAFRKGEKSEAEFWLEMSNGKFIYIYYVAVRDENGVFKGVLEMMQDVTKIRSLTGSRKLLTWDDEDNENDRNGKISESSEDSYNNEFGLTGNTVIGDIVDKYPYIREFMPTVAPEYKKLVDPIQYMVMSKVANLDMIAARGGFTVENLIEIISEKIREEENK